MILFGLSLLIVLGYLAYLGAHPKCPKCKQGRGYQHGLWPFDICDWCGFEWDRFNPPPKEMFNNQKDLK